MYHEFGLRDERIDSLFKLSVCILIHLFRIDNQPFLYSIAIWSVQI